MATEKAPYRIWFRGKPLQRVPQYVDRQFVDATAAEDWAIAELHKRNEGTEKGKRFNRITIHAITAGKVSTDPVREVMFGA
jgi:hypothetical protein